MWKLPTYRSKSTKSCSFGTSRTCLDEMARDDGMIFGRTYHKVMTCSLSSTFSHWCKTSLICFTCSQATPMCSTPPTTKPSKYIFVCVHGLTLNFVIYITFDSTNREIILLKEIFPHAVRHGHVFSIPTRTCYYSRTSFPWI
jgi:hypothetical protein